MFNLINVVRLYLSNKKFVLDKICHIMTYFIEVKFLTYDIT